MVVTILCVYLAIIVMYLSMGAPYASCASSSFSYPSFFVVWCPEGYCIIPVFSCQVVVPVYSPVKQQNVDDQIRLVQNIGSQPLEGVIVFGANLCGKYLTGTETCTNLTSTGSVQRHTLTWKIHGNVGKSVALLWWVLMRVRHCYNSTINHLKFIFRLTKAEWSDQMAKNL